MITTVIFDMDGLLFDTESLYYQCYRKSAEEQGLQFSFELFVSCIGISREEAAHFMRRAFGPKADLARLDHRTFQIVDEYLLSGGDIPFQKGAKEAVEFFYKRGLKIGLASSNIRKWAEFYLQKTGIRHYFSALTTADDVTTLKPNPEVYLKTAAALQSDVVNCLVFEDSVAGATAGIAAGMRTCMVPDLKQPDTFIRENAFKIYPSLKDIYPDIDELLA
jgi:putative hydrolase of the HAD superfamily